MTDCVPFQNFENVHVLHRSGFLRSVMAKLRASETTNESFPQFADQIARLVVAKALEYIEYEDNGVMTPTGSEYDGTKLGRRVCGVSILRAGSSMEHILREWVPSAVFGKVLIQRNEETAMPHLFFDKLPSFISECSVILLDPMLATGGSAMTAIKVLLDKGVEPKNIVFCNIVACPEGIAALAKEFPEVTVVTAEVDSHLNEKKYIIPGLGDYGDRYFGTTMY
eukprot:m.22745 g.22745  ORF g.22745 m.22745 type:complete len:224 (+) comp5477_c0_seq4:1914-2585(+)